MRGERVAAGAHRDTLNDELALQKRELERWDATLKVKTHFVGLLKGNLAAKDVSFVRLRKKLEARLPCGRFFLRENLTETTAHQNQLRDEVGQLSSVGGPSVARGINPN